MGGAVFNMQGNLTIRDSTIVNNDAFGGADSVPNHAQGIGGAVFNLNGNFSATGSTFAKNSASAYASQIYNLEYDGVEARTAQTTLRDTIVFGGTGGGFDVASDKNTSGITPPAGSAADANVSQFDLVGTTFAQDHGTITGSPRTSNPLLGPLRDNGGLTKTMALKPASPAIDAGRSFGLSTDQKDDLRRVDFSGVPNASGGNGADIGAFEVRRQCTYQITPSEACHALMVSLAGKGAGHVSAPGISCPGHCSGSYGAQATITLKPTAAPGSAFSGWGGSCTGAGACRVRMSADRTVTATFKLLPPDTKITTVKINRHRHNATFGFKAIGKATGFQCALLKKPQRKPSFSRCSPAKTYTHLRAGDYTFFVRALNAAGPDRSPAMHSFTIT